MNRILKYILSSSIVIGMIVSCSFKEESLLPDSNKNRGTTLITAHIEDFSRHDVGTKAADNQESTINNLAMLVFGKLEDKMVLISEPVIVDDAKLNFVINTTDSDDGQYIANIQDDAKFSF